MTRHCRAPRDREGKDGEWKWKIGVVHGRRRWRVRRGRGADGKCKVERRMQEVKDGMWDVWQAGGVRQKLEDGK